LEYNETIHQQFVDVNKNDVSDMREVLYNILIEFEVPMKLVRLIKQRDALSPLLVIRKVQENQVGLKLNGTQQLIYADGVKFLGDNIDTIKKHTNCN
jgi:hypothetical protein